MVKKKKQKQNRAQPSTSKKKKKKAPPRRDGEISGGNTHGMLGSLRGGMQTAAAGNNKKLNGWITLLLWAGVAVMVFFVLRKFGYL